MDEKASKPSQLRKVATCLIAAVWVLAAFAFLNLQFWFRGLLRGPDIFLNDMNPPSGIIGWTGTWAEQEGSAWRIVDTRNAVVDLGLAVGVTLATTAAVARFYDRLPSLRFSVGAVLAITATIACWVALAQSTHGWEWLPTDVAIWTVHAAIALIWFAFFDTLSSRLKRSKNQ